MTTPSAYLVAIRRLPDLIAELRTQTMPGAAGDRERRAPGPHRAAAARLAPICDADDAYARLHDHAHAIADILDTRPPRVPVYRNHTRVLGLPANTKPDAARRHARTLARFIAHQLPMVADTELIFDIQNDITHTYGRLDRRYPDQPAPERIDARCGRCHKLTLHQHPPEKPGDDQTYRCAACHKWHTETETIERRAARQRELRARKKRTR